MFHKICLTFLFCFSLFGAEEVYLKTPDISRENLTGANVGIRPFRKSGVRIEAEKIQDKLIVHNYGYGGSGLTLSFGGAKEVVDILNQEPITEKSVAVLGAGVIGLTTAYELLEQGYEVHLYADSWIPHLTSNVAAGIWSPLKHPKDLPEEADQHHQRLQEISEKRFLLSTGENPEFAGVKIIPTYSFWDPSRKEQTGEEVIVHFDNGTTKKGLRTYELGLNSQHFLEDLSSKVKERGVILHQCYFEKIDEILALSEPVIINCLSMGAATLFHDDSFIPARGQIAYFKYQPEIDYVYFENIPDSNFFVAIYPWHDRLILCGVYEFGEKEAVIVPEIIERIIENGTKSLTH